MSEVHKNKLLIAAAGSGKTRYLVEQAFNTPTTEKVLISTYTRSNAQEIKDRLREKNRDKTGQDIVPSNILVEEWFTFLLRHGVRPFKATMDKRLKYKRIGFKLSNVRSGAKNKDKNIYWGEEENLLRFYFGKNYRIFSDKISKFIYVCNEKTEGGFTDRISTYFDKIFIDEVQDLAGWDLEIVKLFFESRSNVELVGDPRQTVYLTNHAAKHPNYKNGKIDDFVKEKCKKCNVAFDSESLNRTHRNDHKIASFSSKLYPTYKQTVSCDCAECRTLTPKQRGVYVIREDDIEDLLKIDTGLETKLLRFKNSNKEEMNFGLAKGLTFDRVIIYPTDSIVDWIKGGDDLKDTTRAKFYVALTRSRYSSFIVCDYLNKENFIDGIGFFTEKDTQTCLFV